jgi:hypothetical protein
VVVHKPTPLVHTARVVQRERRHETGRHVGRGRPAPAEHAERSAPATEIAAPSEGHGPATATEAAQVEQSHEGPGDGGQTATTEDHAQVDGSSGEGGDSGSGHSGPG